MGSKVRMIPFSQIDTVRTTDPAQHVGRVYAFRIIEYKEGGKNLIVSRRALLEEEQRASAVEIRRSIVAGARIGFWSGCVCLRWKSAKRIRS